MCLSCFYWSCVEKQFMYDAETQLRKYFTNNKVEYKNMVELIVINGKDIDTIRQHYVLIQNNYIGEYKYPSNNIDELKSQINVLVSQEALREKEHMMEIQKYESNIRILNVEHAQIITRKDAQIQQLLLNQKDYENKLIHAEYKLLLATKDFEMSNKGLKHATDQEQSSQQTNV